MSRDGNSITCGCWGVMVVVNLLVGGWSVDYLLSAIGKNIPFLWDAVIGLLIGELSIPAAVVVAVLKKFGVL